MNSYDRAIRGTGLLSALLLAGGASLQAQSSQQVADYLSVVADHFRIPTAEVEAVAAWEIAPDDLPIVIFMARRAGVPTDVVVTLHRNGQSWMSVARRYSLDAGVFRVPLDPVPESGPLAAPYARPAAEWGELALEDAQIRWLVNLRVFTDQLGLPAATILRQAEASGSFVAALAALRAR